MNPSKLLVQAVGVVLLCVLAAPISLADQWNEATKLTFSEPVEVPGRVLPAGTYWFTNRPNDRQIVQIWGPEGIHLVATILAIPDYRFQPTDRTVVKFVERPHNQPQALGAWFYPGSLYGDEFVYPRG